MDGWMDGIGLKVVKRHNNEGNTHIKKEILKSAPKIKKKQQKQLKLLKKMKKAKETGSL